MKKTFTALLFFLVLTSVSALQTQSHQNQDGTRVVFYIQNQIQQPQDYVEISIQIKSQQPSLEHAIDEAKQIVQQVQSIITKYCQTHAKNKKDCQGVVQTTHHEIDPIYQLVRKVPTFVAFSVAHETVAKIKDVKNIGKLTDDILKSGVSKINSFEWKPLEQVDNEEKAVSQGIQLVNSICHKIGSQLGRIVAVSQVTDYEEEEEKEEPIPQGEEQDEEPQQKEEQQEQPTVVYRFEIICQNKVGKTKK